MLQIITMTRVSPSEKDLVGINRILFVWGGEYMQNLRLQINPVFIPMTSRVIIWDFRLRISD